MSHPHTLRIVRQTLLAGAAMLATSGNAHAIYSYDLEPDNPYAEFVLNGNIYDVVAEGAAICGNERTVSLTTRWELSDRSYGHYEVDCDVVCVDDSMDFFYPELSQADCYAKYGATWMSVSEYENGPPPQIGTPVDSWDFGGGGSSRNGSTDGGITYTVENGVYQTYNEAARQHDQSGLGGSWYDDCYDGICEGNMPNTDPVNEEYGTNAVVIIEL